MYHPHVPITGKLMRWTTGAPKIVGARLELRNLGRHWDVTGHQPPGAHADAVNAWLDRHGLTGATFSTRRDALSTVKAHLAVDPDPHVLEPSPVKLRRVQRGVYRTADGHIEIRQSENAYWQVTSLTDNGRSLLRREPRTFVTLASAQENISRRYRDEN